MDQWLADAASTTSAATRASARTEAQQGGQRLGKQNHYIPGIYETGTLVAAYSAAAANRKSQQQYAEALKRRRLQEHAKTIETANHAGGIMLTQKQVANLHLKKKAISFALTPLGKQAAAAAVAAVAATSQIGASRRQRLHPKSRNPFSLLVPPLQNDPYPATQHGTGMPLNVLRPFFNRGAILTQA